MPDQPIPFIDFKVQYRLIEKELKDAVHRVMDTQQFILKDHGSRLEEAVAQKLGVKFAIGVASGSDALFLALWALGIGPGDEVITTPFTFFATAGCISRIGAKPVFVDIDPATFNIDPSKIKAAINKKTKAILPVHLFGLASDMAAIQKIAKEHSLFVVEDAAQSFGAKYRGKETASMGEAGCLSFFPTKNFGGAGDGGMVTTSSESIAEKIRLLRVHGSKKKYYHEKIGINSRLDEIQAAVLLVKLKYIDGWNALRQKHAADYDRGLAGLPLKTPFVPGPASGEREYSHIYHLYSVLTPRRDALVEFLTKKKIGTWVYYPLPLHLQPCYEFLGYKKGDFPVSEQTASQILALPMYPELAQDALDIVVQSVRNFFK